MNQVTNRRAALAYGDVATQRSAEDNSPHRVIQLLMESGLQRIMMAKSYIQQKRIPEKGEQIGLAISVVEGIRASLDMEKGGEMAVNLSSLYEYMKVTLLEANLHNDEGKLDEVSGLLAQIKSSWDAIPAQLAQQGK